MRFTALGKTSLLIVFLGLFGLACTHMVTEDYGKYLKNNAGQTKLSKVTVGEKYYLPPGTQTKTHKISSYMAGAGNTWVVDCGAMLDETMKSSDITAAFGELEKTDANGIKTGKVIIVDLEKYDYRDAGAHVKIQFYVRENGETKFKKTYSAHGKTQGGKMFFGGAMAMKNAVQQSTKSAIDQIFVEFTQDLAKGKTTAKN